MRQGAEAQGTGLEGHMKQHICKLLFLMLGDEYTGILLYHYLYFCISKMFYLKLFIKNQDTFCLSPVFWFPPFLQDSHR